ncbi:hypothetical protein DPMN_048892 [Dreissena polymorpha]|uniref:Uncharacterized protein n=1 Tax=Dreissena polymorpha TaxID=45954 RepID=A0A9D4DAD9_DREPO|nr:hypothetical protein DPMN_048892 [Dreissena polymorpha]
MDDNKSDFKRVKVGISEGKGQHLPAVLPSCSSICQYVTAELLGNSVLGLDWSTGRILKCTAK